MTERALPELPGGWVWTKLGRICFTTSGGTPSRKNKNYFDGNIPWLKSGELNNGIIKSAEESITEDAIRNSSTKIIPKGTLLIALYGATVGKLGILGIDAAINQAVCAIYTNNSLDYKFLFWYLSSYRNELLNARIGGAQPNISQQIVNDIPIPLPPHPEQCRIVTKIEELFTRLDAGVSELKKTQAQLKRYRQSVLKAACEGKIVPTEAELVRAEGRAYEPADVLLARILKERREKWNGKGKYKEPAAPDTSGLPALPEGWGWATYEQIGKWSGGGTPSTIDSTYWKDGTIPWISPKDMKCLKIHESKDKITEVALDNSSANLIPSGSILFVVRSGILRRTLPVALTMVDATVNQDIKSLTPLVSIDADYLLVTALAFNTDFRRPFNHHN